MQRENMGSIWLAVCTLSLPYHKNTPTDSGCHWREPRLLVLNCSRVLYQWICTVDTRNWASRVSFCPPYILLPLYMSPTAVLPVIPGVQLNSNKNIKLLFDWWSWYLPEALFAIFSDCMINIFAQCIWYDNLHIAKVPVRVTYLL